MYIPDTYQNYFNKTNDSQQDDSFGIMNKIMILMPIQN